LCFYSDPSIKPTRCTRLVKPLSDKTFVLKITSGTLADLHNAPNLMNTMKLYDAMENPKANSTLIRSAKLSVLLTAVFSNNEVINNDANRGLVDTFIKGNFDSAGNLKKDKSGTVVQSFKTLLAELGVSDEVREEFGRNLTASVFQDLTCLMSSAYGKNAIAREDNDEVGQMFNDFKDRVELQKEFDRLLRENDRAKHAKLAGDANLVARKQQRMDNIEEKIDAHIQKIRDRNAAEDRLAVRDGANTESLNKLRSRFVGTHVMKEEGKGDETNDARKVRMSLAQKELSRERDKESLGSASKRTY
jgi:hypothetical protein